ncbi:MAG: hypothetical protein HZC12_05475 [Nitrospirae bacterium]|nr:hypothetical protein [Nitrospirota bacterium]
MREFFLLLAPHFWTLKNSVLRFDRATYIKSFFFILLATGFWLGTIRVLNIVLVRLHGMSAEVGAVIVLKGFALLLMIVFFLLIFSGLLFATNCFYLSKELPMALSFPVLWDNIYLSKWVETLIKSSWMVLLFGIPVFLSFGKLFNVSAWYYVWFLPALALFAGISVGIGILIAIVLMAVLPARQARNLFVFMGLLMFVVLFLLFRFLRPERFANPEWFATLAIFLSEMKLPVFVFLPSMWTIEVLSPFFGTGEGTPVLYGLLLISTLSVLIIFGHWLFKRFYYNGWVKAQEGQKVFLTSSEIIPTQAGRKGFSLNIIYRGFLKITAGLARRQRRALIEKDLTVFFRDIAQWSQSLLLMALVIIYLFSIRALPLDWGTFLSVQLKYIISFLNVGLVGIVIAAISSRFVFPLVSREGNAFWIIRVSPISLRRFLWSKYLLAFIPLFLLAQVLIVVSNLFLRVDVWFMILGILTGSIMAASITGLAIGMGASYARFPTESTTQSPTGFGGTVYMLLSIALIAITIALEVIPTAVIFIKEVTKMSLTLRAWLIMGLFFLSALILNISALWFSMKRGEKKLIRLEVTD